LFAAAAALLVLSAVEPGIVLAQERAFGASGYGPLRPSTMTWYGYPSPLPLAPGVTVWSADAEVRDRQAIARQLSVIDYARWHSYSLAPDPWIGPLPYDPAFIWGFPSVDVVAQPVGHRRIYDGRGGYSYLPIYANEPPPVLPPPEGRAPPFNGEPLPPPRGFSW
jgi:hypothetical protein